MRIALVALSCYAAALAAEPAVDFGGHTKARFTGQVYPKDSLFREISDPTSVELEADLRLNLALDAGPWSFNGAYQLFGPLGNDAEFAEGLPPELALLFPRLPNDDRRLFDLTKVLHNSKDNSVVHRLDRLWLGYTGEKTVLRAGRQAISWGNGLFYAPMDLVNPFDPAAIDTEYKSGDDMLYLQYLRDNADDLQAATVVRRDPLTGEVESDQATFALKYHGFAGAAEYDLLIARHYSDTVFGIGGNRSLGGAIWRGDLVISKAAGETWFQVVTNLSYSWTWAGKNMSGALEYYYNQFGQRGGRYSPLELAANPELLIRLLRGDAFTLGRHYLAGSLLIEVSPLLTLTPTLLANPRDPSALFQLIAQRSISDNMTFLGSLNLPLGMRGTEFGGIESGVPGKFLSDDASLFAQLAYYF